MSKPQKSVRGLLTAIGIGHFNATMIIPYMFIAPATTDPKAGQIILLVEHVQKALYNLGATDVAISGRLDPATARALRQVAGDDWERMSWGGNVAAIVNAQEGGGMMFAPEDGSDAPAPQAMAIGGPLDFLPDVPGGLLTYGLAAFLLYRHLKRRR